MIWIVTEESQHYNRDFAEAKKSILSSIRKFRKELDADEIEKRIQKIFFDPSSEVLHKITDEEDLESSIIVSPRRPEAFGYAPIGFFSVIDLPSEAFPFTKEQIAISMSKEKILSLRMGLRIKTATKTFDDMAGADVLREDIMMLMRLERLGIDSVSGLFLFGVAGAGKSYFAECFAGEAGRISGKPRRFAELDLPYFMSLPNPTKSIDEVFSFLLSQKNEKYVLLIDEIEKMFEFGAGGNLVARQVFGKMLTWLNNIYSDPSSNVTFVATANDITEIMKNNPEFLRKGRFKRLYFLNYPTLENARKIFELYLSLGKTRLRRILKERFAEYKEQHDSGSQESPLEAGAFSEYAHFFKMMLDGEVTAEQLLSYLTLSGLDSQTVIQCVEETYRSAKKVDGEHFIYTPPEIQAVVEELQNRYLLAILENYQEVTVEMVQENILPPKVKEMLSDKFRYVSQTANTIVPLQISAKSGVVKQLAQAMSFDKGQESMQQFINVS